MGMFDNLRITPDLLPVSEEEKLLLARSCAGEFQTKSLQRSLTVVEITPKGKLLWASYDTRIFYAPDELSEEAYLVKEGMEVLELMGGIQIPLNQVSWVEEKDFTGQVRFYDEVGELWYEFCALFDNGILLQIIKISPPPPAPFIDII